MKNQKGVGILEIFVVLVLVAWVVVYAYSISSIDIEKTNQLKEMVVSVEKTQFESTFKKIVDEKMSDGSISNAEFEKISEAYTKYELSKINGNEAKYIENLNQPKVVENKTVLTDSEMETVNYVVYFLYAIFGAIMLWVGVAAFTRK